MSDLQVKPMSPILLYQTSDPKFADHVITELKKKNILCHQTGSGVNNLNANVGNWTDHQISIYISNNKDYRRANETLIALGASVEKPIKLPSRGVLVLIVLAIALLIVAIATNFK